MSSEGVLLDLVSLALLGALFVPGLCSYPEIHPVPWPGGGATFDVPPCSLQTLMALPQPLRTWGVKPELGGEVALCPASHLFPQVSPPAGVAMSSLVLWLDGRSCDLLSGFC